MTAPAAVAARHRERVRTRRGAPLPWGDIPARPFLPVDAAGRLSDAARQTIIEIITEHLNGA